MNEIIRRFFLAALGFAVGWLVIFVESMLCETAYGGPFTIVVSFIMKFVFTAMAVNASLLAGLVLLLPGVRDLWRRIGSWSLLMSVAAVCVMIFATRLGLRTPDPVSYYKMMPFPIWSACLFAIVFPIVNLPKRRAWDDCEADGW